MVYPVNDIADYFIWRANQDEDLGENISNLKLQKLVYYAQGFSLAIRNQPLFDAPIEAWKHGPVIHTLWQRHRQHGAGAIPTPDDFDPEQLDFDQDTRDLLEDVYSVYGQYSAWGLRNLTHDEPPWKDTPAQSVISHEKMRAYFVTQLIDAGQA